mgnify:CR=1 FL=1
MGINNLLYQYQNTNEFVCSDGRMSVNGICKPLEPEPKKQNNQELINQIVTANKNDKNFAKDLLTTDKYRDGFGITSEGNYVNKFSGGDPGSVTGKDYSKDVKSTFEWDFDKVGNKIANFGTTVKDNIDAYTDYVENNFGIPSNVQNVARVGAVVKGVSTYGMAGALVPFAIPFVAGAALNNQAVKEQEAAINREETRDLQGRIDKGEFGSNTLTPQDKGRTDKGGNGSGSSSDGSKGSRGEGMGGFGGGADRG